MRGALRLALFTAITAALAVSAAGCSHEIESPGISSNPPPGAVDPDLACNEKTVSSPFTTVNIKGQNMTPMPSKTLEDKRQLILPRIQLKMETPLAGAAPLAEPITIADDPANPTASRVKWTSESQMSFDIFGEADMAGKPVTEKLPTGVMTIIVTNPDGKKATSINRTLAIVPRPTISEIKPAAICDDQSEQIVVITGQNFLFHGAAGAEKAPTVMVGDKPWPAVDPTGCETVEGNFVETNVRLCSGLSIKIPAGTYKVTTKTELDVVVTNPAPADCKTSETIKLTINPPPRVDAVVPASVCEGGSQITVTGDFFQAGAKVTLKCPASSVDASKVAVESATKLTATFGGGATPGEKCDVIVTNPDSCEDRPLPHKTVTVVTGPIVFYVDPPVVVNGVNMQATIFATSITKPLLAGAVTITDAAGAETKLDPKEVTGYPNRVQVTIKSDQKAGVYDVTLRDSSACFATLPKGLTVVRDKTVTIREVVPPFGWTGEDTAITVFRDTAAAAPANKPFLAGARLFLNPVGATPTDLAVPLLGVSVLDGDRLTATVPKGTAVKDYDLVLVNPDGTVAVKTNAYKELAAATPIITQATPSSVVTGTADTVVLTGRNFQTGSTYTMRCVDPAGGTAATTTITKGAGGTATSQTLTINTAAPAGSVCVLRITNADGSYFDYSALGVTNSSFNLSAPKPSTALNVARRALVGASGSATAAQRFVYAIGGDNGTPAGALDSYEFAPVDLFGTVSAWSVSPVTLASKRTLAGTTTVGRYIYLVGGNDGTGPVASAERALILSPLETPEVTDLDLKLDAAKGLEPGLYQYRVSATFDATDTDNPGGESLASEVFSLKVPTFAGKKVVVTLVYRAPLDSLGAAVPGVSGYKIYRTAKDGAAGSETLLATVTGAATLTFEDDGSKTPTADKPLPLGSTGKWASLPAMGTKRSGVGVAAAFDPADATSLYVYALMGRSAATTNVGTYEFLKVTVAANGRQTAAASWTAGTVTNPLARDEFGAWTVTRAQSTLVAAGDTWIYAGSGKISAGTLSGQVDATKVQAGGQLTAWTTTLKSFGSDHAGYGVCAANSRLYVFGGQGAAPTKGAKAGIMISPVPTLDSNSWNNEGLTMTHGRYLMGSAVQSAFIFLLGGQTDEPLAASKSTETVIW
ncbi:MAG: hypothetical protein HYV09_15015 [Deltaproteobacteria bacterium]|nr:hypothetical protein [Deltaproteobacteria bacterium]